MMRPSSKSLFVLIMLSVIVSGCGYHLRGQGEFALSRQLQSLTIEGLSVYSGFGRELTDVIESNGVVLVPKADQPDVLLELKAPSRRRDVLSVDSSVYAREYSLVTAIRFRLVPSEQYSTGDTNWQTLEVRRDLVVNPNDVLGSDYEAERLNNEMDRELADRLVFRLRSLQTIGDR